MKLNLKAATAIAAFAALAACEGQRAGDQISSASFGAATTNNLLALGQNFARAGKPQVTAADILQQSAGAEIRRGFIRRLHGERAGLPVDTVDIADNSFGQIAIGNNRAMNRPFIGTIDDVRVYDRALSAAEIAGLAGREASFHKPF